MTAHRTGPDPDTLPSGLVTAKICMTSHSAKDKAHWFHPDRELGGGCQSNVRTSERLADGFAAVVCVCVCAEIFYLHTCETAGRFHVHVCSMGDVE